MEIFFSCNRNPAIYSLLKSGSKNQFMFSLFMRYAMQTCAHVDLKYNSDKMKFLKRHQFLVMRLSFLQVPRCPCKLWRLANEEQWLLYLNDQIERDQRHRTEKRSNAQFCPANCDFPHQKNRFCPSRLDKTLKFSAWQPTTLVQYYCTPGAKVRCNLIH